MLGYMGIMKEEMETTIYGLGVEVHHGTPKVFEA